jgi:HlyD family secretion protein
MKKILMTACLVAAIAAGVGCESKWVGNGTDKELTLYGNVDIREVQLGFRVAGRLQAMQFEEGDAVKTGDLMATLDDQPLREALAVAAAQVLEAKANLDRARTGSRPQEIQQAQALVTEAEAALDNADKQLVRQRQLFDDGLNSKRDLDNATATKDQAAARLSANREALALAVEGFREEDISAAAAGLAAAQARRDQAQTKLDDTHLLAPSNGVIQVRAREPGAMLGVGAPVYTLSLTETVYVRAYVAETSLGRLQPGATVYVTSDSSDQRYEGQVGFISPRAEFTPKTVETPELRTDLVYRLRIVVGNADQALRQGMPVTIEVPLEQG